MMDMRSHSLVLNQRQLTMESNPIIKMVGLLVIMKFVCNIIRWKLQLNHLDIMTVRNYCLKKEAYLHIREHTQKKTHLNIIKGEEQPILKKNIFALNVESPSVGSQY